ncbi:MAG: sugar ABC transporter permease [Chloroflexi bacterium]|nr:sugar ABC transporter permease [Chloroflexota bacterium]
MTAAAPAAAVGARRRFGFGGGGGRVSRVAYLYLVPAFLVMGIITLYPLLYQVWMSFTAFGIQNIRPTSPAPEWVGLDNYINVIASQLAIPNFNFIRIVLYNLVWAFSNVIIHVILGVAIAVVLNTRGLWFRRFYRALYILPVVIPPIIVATVWRNMYDPQDGAINLMLAGVGTLLRIPADFFYIDWLRQVEDPIGFIPLPLAFYAMLITNTWLGWPLNSVVATGALQSIPNELYEAAEIDGASSWQKFRNITVAYLRPAMLPYAIYGFVITFNLFHLSYFMSQGGPFGRTEQLVTQAYRLVNEQQLYGVGAAFCVIMFFILLAITLVTNWLTKATATYNL